MKKNKLILFDWGGIVESHRTGYTGDNAWYDLFVECGGSEEPDLSKYECSALSTLSELEEVFDELKEIYGLKVNFEEFTDKYKKIFDRIDYYQDVRDYELSLKDKCYVGILSNLLIIDRDRIDKQLGLSNYDYVFLSYEFGTRKPHIEMYEKAQEKLPFSKENILFIDDRLENVETAKKFGWNAYQATGLELDKIKEICEEFLNN